MEINMLNTIKRHKFLSIGLGLLLACSVVWAVADLAGQANQTAANAGLQQSKATLLSLKNAKPTVQKSSINWKKYNDLQNKFNVAADELTKLEDNAQKALANGPLSDADKKAGLDAAQKVKTAGEKFAAFQEKSNCITLAKQTRTGIDSLLANADLVFNDIDADKISAASEKNAQFTNAKKDYLADAKTNLSDADKAEMKSNMIPALQDLGTQVNALTGQIANLLSDVKNQVAGGGVGGLVSCASNAATSDNPAATLLTPITSLLDLVKNLGTSITDTISALTDL